MKVSIPSGKYVLAVSGGVDSMVLLDILRQKDGVEIVVAHFNHGIRTDSNLDEELVRQEAAKNNLVFEAARGMMGKNTSEEQAREARYSFLNKVKAKHEADAIVTAHHLDDLIETAFINLLRGTGPKGLISMSSGSGVLRPLLDYSKNDILTYAKKNNIKWREDSTNEDTAYLRNHVRKVLTSKLTEEARDKLLKIIKKITDDSQEIEELNATISQLLIKDGELDRKTFSVLPYKTANEILSHILRERGVRDLDKKTIERLNVVLRTAQSGTKHDVKGETKLIVNKQTARFTS